mmetsp:Transcript_27749/g.52516  ORF Transcript_27749/g.52516 Transcript_27749/m.52516 type:complete len:282 (-) Transcript_27749:396-1241(-)
MVEDVVTHQRHLRHVNPRTVDSKVAGGVLFPSGELLEQNLDSRGVVHLKPNESKVSKNTAGDGAQQLQSLYHLVLRGDGRQIVSFILAFFDMALGRCLSISLELHVPLCTLQFIRNLVQEEILCLEHWARLHWAVWGDAGRQNAGKESVRVVETRHQAHAPPAHLHGSVEFLDVNDSFVGVGGWVDTRDSRVQEQGPMYVLQQQQVQLACLGRDLLPAVLLEQAVTCTIPQRRQHQHRSHQPLLSVTHQHSGSAARQELRTRGFVGWRQNSGCRTDWPLLN